MSRPEQDTPALNPNTAGRLETLAGCTAPPKGHSMKHIGFLSFGHWTPSPQSQTRSASDALLQSIELAVAAEELGADGAYFRVHHFARQLGSPFPLLAACGAKTKRIETGTAVIDMRYENPLYMAEDAGSADLARPALPSDPTVSSQLSCPSGPAPDKSRSPQRKTT